MLISSEALCEIVTIGFCNFSSVTVMVEEGWSKVSGFQSMGLEGDKSPRGFDCVAEVWGSTGTDSGSGELDPARPEVGGEFGFVLAGIVATRACSAEITTLGGISLGEKFHCNLQPLVKEETCISLERGSLGRSSTSCWRRLAEATFGVPLLGKTPTYSNLEATFCVALLVLPLCKTPPYSRFGVALPVLLLGKTHTLLIGGKTPPYSKSSPRFLF